MKNTFLYSGSVLLILLIGVGYWYYPRLNIITGFAAKNVCSCIFEAERSLESVQEGDNNFQPVSYSRNKVHPGENWATSTFLGLQRRKAVHLQGLGCVLLPDDHEKPDLPAPKRIKTPINEPYPIGHLEPEDTLFLNVDYDRLEDALTNAFEAEGDPVKNSRAVVVLYKNKLLAEKYSQGILKDTKLLGWSMTKSITNAVLGVLEKNEKISLDQKDLFPEWQNDHRSQITLNNLLQMNSGLEWKEDYTTISDVTKMLFLETDMSKSQLHKSIVGRPGDSWNYSSGTSNLLSGFIRNQFNSHQEYLDFWYSGLIDRIGMHSMTVEADLSGNYVGSSYSWATARDWGKFGLLFLNRGNWNGDQVLDEAWVDYSATPTNGSAGEYGAHFWLNAGGKYPDAPRDLYSSNGFQGQHVFIIPSLDLVIVRFGLTEHPVFDMNAFLKSVISSIDHDQ